MMALLIQQGGDERAPGLTHEDIPRRNTTSPQTFSKSALRRCRNHLN